MDRFQSYFNQYLDGDVRAYVRLIQAYLTKTKQDLHKTEYYLDKYERSQFEELIKEHYVIKGDVTYDKILKAKRKVEGKEPSEHEQQAELCKYLDSLDIKYFAVPNGTIFGFDSTTSARYSNYLKAEGMRKGSPDLVILPKGKVLFLEMKTTKGRLSPAQKKWQEYFDSKGYSYEVAKGLDQAKKIVDKYK